MKKAAVLGFPIKHSLSPRLHSFWLHTYNIEGSYEAIEVAPEQLAATLKSLAMRNISGVNLTVPHKEAALTIVDSMDETAKRIGAINTIIVGKDGKLEGRNTDAYGFTQNLLAVGYKQIADKPAVVIGAGGAARAVIVALQDLGARNIRIINRTFEKAQLLAQEFSGMEQSHFLPKGETIDQALSHIHRVKAHKWLDDAVLKDAGLLVNTSVLGMENQPPLVISLDQLPKDAFVADIVYAPLETELLKEAKARGNKTVDGFGMLLHQARPAFKAFFGVDPEVNEGLRQHVLSGR